MSNGKELQSTLKSKVESCKQFTVILEPDQDTPEWWAGAPSVLISNDETFYLAARMREGNSPRGHRGYENRILQSIDGESFTLSYLGN
jgi:hypothetical protein